MNKRESFLDVASSLADDGWQERLECVFNHLSDVVACVSEERTLERVTRTDSGLPPEVLIGRDVFELVAEEYRADIAAALDAVFDRGQPSRCDALLLRLDGTSGWYSCRFFPFRDGCGRLEAIVVCTDIAHRKQTLAQSERRLRTITDSLPVLIAHVGGDMRYRFYNAAHEEWFGPDCGDLTGIRMDELLGPSFESFRPSIERALGGDCEPNEALLVLPDGRERFVNVVRVPDPGGDGYYVLVTDITERKRQEEFVERTARLAATGTFATAIAHEVKTPLAAALTAIAAARRLLGQAGCEGTVADCLRHADTEISRMVSVVRSVECYAHTGELTLERRDLYEVVTLAAQRNRRTADEAAVRVETHPPADPVRLPLDALKMEQVLINLIENAVQACRPGGLVTVRVLGADTAGSDTAGADPACAVVVEDNGCGMTAEQQARIFEPFYTTRGNSGGTGFGLSVAQGIIAAHGGTIDVESEPGRGTRFVVRLPVSRG